MCSMSLTVVVSARWNGVVMRPAISSGGRPVYCQIAAMTGMRMSGKDVDRRAQRGERADDQEQQRQHDERIGAPQCDADDGDHLTTTPQSPAMTAVTDGKFAAPLARLVLTVQCNIAIPPRRTTHKCVGGARIRPICFTLCVKQKTAMRISVIR